MKKENGFTLVEVVVSFSLAMIVIVYLLKTIAVVNSEENNLLIEQQYSVYQSMVLKQIYNDIGFNVTTAEIDKNDSNNIIITIDGENKILTFDNKSIIYDNIIYELPDGCNFDKDKKIYSIASGEKYYIIKINLKVNDKDKIMKIIIQN